MTSALYTAAGSDAHRGSRALPHGPSHPRGFYDNDIHHLTDAAHSQA